jgi:hypothetical protein
MDSMIVGKCRNYTKGIFKKYLIPIGKVLI